MKLVEIKDIRPGQIRKVTAFNQWKDEEEFEVLAVIEASGLGEYAEFDTYAEFYDIKTKQLMEDDSEELRFYENGELIGKLGITHRTEDGKLVEIPRTAEFQMMLSNSNGATHDFMLSTAKSTSASRKATQTTLALKPQTTSMEAANWWILNSNVSASSASPTNL